MISLKDDQVDRRKVEVQQCMELKRTNRDIAFLCPCLSNRLCLHRRGGRGRLQLVFGVYHTPTSIFTKYPCLDGHRRRGLAHRGVYTGPSAQNPSFGAHGVREIPVLIPNTEVKPHSGDYTATVGN